MVSERGYPSVNIQLKKKNEEMSWVVNALALLVHNITKKEVLSFGYGDIVAFKNPCVYSVGNSFVSNLETDETEVFQD